jgi:hypothetical protein
MLDGDVEVDATFATIGRRQWKQREGEPQAVRASSGVIMSETSIRQKASAGQVNLQQRGPDLRRRLDTWLDEALEQTFPASDPISTPPYTALPATHQTTREMHSRHGALPLPKTGRRARRIR